MTPMAGTTAGDRRGRGAGRHDDPRCLSCEGSDRDSDNIGHSTAADVQMNADQRTGAGSGKRASQRTERPPTGAPDNPYEHVPNFRDVPLKTDVRTTSTDGDTEPRQGVPAPTPTPVRKAHRQHSGQTHAPSPANTDVPRRNTHLGRITNLRAPSDQSEATADTHPSTLHAASEHSTDMQRTVVLEDHAAVHEHPCSDAVAKPSSVPTGSLYGRETESQILQNELLHFVSTRRDPDVLRGTVVRPKQFVLVAGGSGTGKTALVQSMRPFVTAVDTVNGYFCPCKFDQLDMIYNACPMTHAMASYVSQVVEEGEEAVQQVRNKIIDSFGNDAIVHLNEMVPAMVDILGKPDFPSVAAINTSSSVLHDAVSEPFTAKSSTAPAVPERTGINTVSKFVSDGQNTTGSGTMSVAPTFRMFFRTICSAEKPVILVLDDIQWANENFLRELESLIIDDNNQGLLLMATCRDDVPTDSPISQMLRRIEERGVEICSVGLQHLEQETVQHMVNDIFDLPTAPSTAMTKFIYKQSQGVPYHIIEIVRWLAEDHHALKYDEYHQHWIIRQSASRCNNCCPDGTIESRISSIPIQQQKVLMVVASLGTHAFEDLILVALQEDAAESMDALVKKGILAVSEMGGRRRYAFCHDRVQKASYELIPADVLPAYHLEIGLRMIRSLDRADLDRDLLVVMGQVKLGIHLVTDANERLNIAALCIRAAEKATQLSSIHAASEHLHMAFGLLGDNPWRKQSYDLSLVLHKYAAEAEFSASDSPRVDELLDEIFINAKTFDDKVGAYITKIHVLITRSEADLAIETAVDVLAKLGVNLKNDTTNLLDCMSKRVLWSFMKIRRRLRSKSDQSIMRIPYMTDPTKLAAMQILNLLFLTTWTYRPSMFAPVVLKMLRLTLNDGLSAMSSVAFGGFGALLCYTWNVKEGLRYARLCLDLLDHFDARAYLSRCYGFVYGTVYAYTRPWNDICEPLLTAQRVGLQTGDFQFANFCGYLSILYMLDAGTVKLTKVLEQMEEQSSANNLHGNFHELGMYSTIEVVRKVLDPDADLLDHSGYLDDALEEALRKRNIYCLRCLTVGRSFLAMAGGDYKRAIEETDKLAPYSERRDGTVMDNFGYTIEGMSCFWMARRTKGIERQQYISRGKNRMKILKKLAKLNPYHCLAKAVMLEAEYSAIKRRFKVAEEMYTHALALADQVGCAFEIAWANQLAGIHYVEDRKNRTVGVDHLRAAARRFDEFGAVAASRCIHRDIERIEEAWMSERANA